MEETKKVKRDLTKLSEFMKQLDDLGKELTVRSKAQRETIVAIRRLVSPSPGSIEFDIPTLRRKELASEKMRELRESLSSQVLSSIELDAEGVID